SRCAICATSSQQSCVGAVLRGGAGALADRLREVVEGLTADGDRLVVGLDPAGDCARRTAAAAAEAGTARPAASGGDVVVDVASLRVALELGQAEIAALPPEPADRHDRRPAGGQLQRGRGL